MHYAPPVIESSQHVQALLADFGFKPPKPGGGGGGAGHGPHHS